MEHNHLRGGIYELVIPGLTFVETGYVTSSGQPIKIKVCSECGRLFFIEHEIRPVEYCSNACRQKAYRERKRTITKMDKSTKKSVLSG